MVGDTKHAAALLDKCFRAHLLDVVQAALEFLLQTGRQPDILHCHDWSTAILAEAYWYSPEIPRPQATARALSHRKCLTLYKCKSLDNGSTLFVILILSHLWQWLPC